MADEPKKRPEDEAKSSAPAKPKITTVWDRAILEALNSVNVLNAGWPALSLLHNINVNPQLLSGTSIPITAGIWPGKYTNNLYKKFEEQLVSARKNVEEQTKALIEEKISAKEKEQKIAALESSLGELRAKEQIGFLLSRVNPLAQQQLLASEEFRKTFLDAKECEAFVLSVDIRRSTELMLKARKPEAFADFIMTLCTDLMNIITEHYGVFDKFTGDGVLAFFPSFYSGDSAAYYAVAAADRCHASFQEHYQRFRRSFTSVLTETGLGIGLDYGTVHLVQMAGGLTVVGSPVVYACRLSGSPAGVTLLNQPAYEVVSDKFGAACFINETKLEIKHEGSMLAYQVRLTGRQHKPDLPNWVNANGQAKSLNSTLT